MRMCDSQLFCSLSGRCSGLAGADPNGLFKISDDDFAIANPAGPRDIGNGLEYRFDDGIVYRYFEFSAGPVLCFIHFGHRHTLNAQLGDGVPQFVQLEWPDYRSDDFHDVHTAM
jgi:hypothetical protein